MEKQIEAKLRFFQTNAAELVPLSCLYQEENNCHQESMC